MTRGEFSPQTPERTDMMMSTLAIVTRSPEQIKDYLGFGWHEVDRGKNQFGDHVIIAQGPEEHRQWNAQRLASGLHGAWPTDDLDAWKEEWGYVSNGEESRTA